MVGHIRQAAEDCILLPAASVDLTQVVVAGTLHIPQSIQIEDIPMKIKSPFKFLTHFMVHKTSCLILLLVGLVWGTRLSCWLLCWNLTRRSRLTRSRCRIVIPLILWISLILRGWWILLTSIVRWIPRRSSGSISGRVRASWSSIGSRTVIIVLLILLRIPTLGSVWCSWVIAWILRIS